MLILCLPPLEIMGCYLPIDFVGISAPTGLLIDRATNRIPLLASACAKSPGKLLKLLRQ